MWCLHTSAVESISSVSSVTGTYIAAIGILTGSNGGTGISQTLIDICMHKDTHKKQRQNHYNECHYNMYKRTKLRKVTNKLLRVHDVAMKFQAFW